jgi:biopolymer transport protein ExbB
MFTEFDWIKIARESPAMLVLIVCSVVTVGVAIERIYYYWLRRGNPDQAAREVTQRMQRGEVKEALATCQHTAHPVGAALQVVVGSPVDRQGDVDEQLLVVLTNQKLLLERNLNVLGTMAAVAPLVGLLGTVWGIMRAFHDMALWARGPSVVAAGTRLITTAIGPGRGSGLMLYNHFARRMNVMLIAAENHARAPPDHEQRRRNAGCPHPPKDDEWRA